MRAAKWCAALCVAGSGISFGVFADPPKEVMSITRWDGVKSALCGAQPVLAGHLQEVIVQIMGIGPSATIRVDESGKPKQ